MQHLFLFVAGAAFGSFLNVLVFRYDPEKFLFSKKAVGFRPSGSIDPEGGRSRCLHCSHRLRWFELIPLVSFFIQRGRCRRCHARVSFQYPLVEILSGLIFVAVPWRIASLFPLLTPFHFLLFSVIWIVTLWVLLLMAVIDFRTTIIPDEIHFLLLGAALCLALIPFTFGVTGGSVLGAYSLLFGVSSLAWVNKLIGILIGGLGMAFILVVTRGKGIGMGDVKLSAALGALFGWPDILVLLGGAFVFGAVAGLLSMAFGGKTLKSALAFGPFIALSAVLLFFGGFEFVGWYLRVFIGS
ncbi:MAG: hypothetical protein FJY98_01460 [Candidatus Liptonbacteria bacterium]|nr:hypothetical protein [Candidatus Liptonbacteria bacterium]